MIHEKKELSFGKGVSMKYIKNLKKFNRYEELCHLHDLNFLLAH